MSQSYFVIPGLLLPESAKTRVSAEALKTAGSLTRGLCGELLEQSFQTRAYRHALHLVWLWRVLTRRTKPPAVAAFEWMACDGPELSTEVWNFDLAHEDAAGKLTAVDLSARSDMVEKISTLLTVPLREAGFTLQRWDSRIFVTRKSNWDAVVPPFSTRLYGKSTESDIEGDNAAVARNLMKTLSKLLESAALDTPRGTVNFVWISGGGHAERFYPPTLIRTLLSDEPAPLFWSQNAGILNHRTGALTGADKWPADAPAGDRIALIDALYEPYLREDWAGWEEKLPSVIDTVQKLKTAGLAKDCPDALIVALGASHSVSIPVRVSAGAAGSILARLKAMKQKEEPAEHWIFEREEARA